MVSLSCQKERVFLKPFFDAKYFDYCSLTVTRSYMLNGASVTFRLTLERECLASPHPVSWRTTCRHGKHTHTFCCGSCAALGQQVCVWVGREGGNPSSFVSFVEYKAEKMSRQRKIVGEWQGPREVRE